jgi:multisubunit Na+/H+ antiporter MnhE subunit
MRLRDLAVLTLLQMSTTLRPILGEASQPITSEKKFFLVHWAECSQAEIVKKEAETLAGHGLR